MESNTISKYLKLLIAVSLLAVTSIAYALPESLVYKCWSNGGYGKDVYYSDTRLPGCLPLKVPKPTPALAITQLPETVFSKNSFWYKPIPANVTLHANTTAFTAELVRLKTKYYDRVDINISSFASPVYIPDSKVIPVKVAFDNCQKRTYIDPIFIKMVSSVPIPSYAVQSAGGDGEMTIYNPATKTIWELWHAKRDSSGNWSACWGGKMENTNTNAGIFQLYYGTTATGLPFLGGQITAEELEKGEIKHVIGISLPELAHWNVISWPATRSDGYNPNKLPNRIAEGQRFRLDPKVNVDALPMTKAGKIIAKAAQKYGFVVWDKAGSVSLRAQNSLSYTTLGKPNPYPALFEQKSRNEVMNGFPWERIQFLPMDYGKP